MKKWFNRWFEHIFLGLFAIFIALVVFAVYETNRHHYQACLADGHPVYYCRAIVQ